MPDNPSIFCTQTRGLLLRVWHNERRQPYNLFCTILVPPFALLFLAILGRNIKAREIRTFPFQQQPEGAFAPRAFNPVQCIVSLAPSLGVGNATERCIRDGIIKDFTVPVYAPPQLKSLVGRRNARPPMVNSGLLGGLSLEPFVYPPALDDWNSNTTSFYDTQTSYDGIFLYSYFRGNRGNLFYRLLTTASQLRLTDQIYNTKTLSFDTEQAFKDHIFNSWFNGSVHNLYSMGLSIQQLSRNEQGDLSASATVFFNESVKPNCSVACPLVSNVIKTHNAIYKTLLPDKTAVAYLRRMPVGEIFNDLGLIRLVISVVIGFTTHFWLPSFLRFLVYERESRIRAMMLMTGLGGCRYWFGTYIGFYVQYATSIVLIVMMGLATRLPFFTLNAPASYIILFFLWGHTLIAFAMVVAPFFTIPETALTLSWIFIIILNIMGGQYLGRRVSDENASEGIWFAIMLLPSFAYLRSVYYAGVLNSAGKGIAVWSEMYNGNELGMCTGKGPFCRSYAFLVVQWAVLLVLALYFDHVLPTAVGRRLHPLFFVGFKRNVKYLIEEDGESAEGADVVEEESRAADIVENIQNEPFDGVVLDKLSKTYAGKKPVKALQGLSLVARKNEVLTILGHNGAGKTTAFQTLVGELEATSGSAYVCGKSILTEMDEVRTMMGVAPQQDILWDVLTVEEHLYFYGRAKTLSGQKLKDAVEASLESVQLTYARKRMARKLSGGMKRRLSVSIALIGDPHFLVLDELSAGLDILAREKLWRSIKRVKEGKTIMLTTHSLEEAETLSNRIAILSNGQLKCIGKVEELKLRLGKGHHLSVALPPLKVGALHDVIMETVPGARIETQVGGSIEYVLPRSFGVTEIFELMARERDELEIRDWAVNQSTLEDVFIEVIRRSRRIEDNAIDAGEP